MVSPDLTHRRPEVSQKETGPNYALRLQRTREMLQKQGVDTAMVSSPANLRYLTGFNGLEPEDREAFTFITPKSAHLITSRLYPDQVQAAQPLFAFEDIRQMPKALERIAREEDIKTVGIEGNHMVVDEQDMLHSLGLKTRKIPLSEIRRVKDDNEIEAIRKACDAGDRVFEQILPFLHTGVTEREIADQMGQLMKKLGYQQEAFPTIVAFGANTANPHYMPTGTQLERNQFVLFDFGLKSADGYPSDMTRTVFFGRQEDMTPEQKHMYTTVQKANQLAINYLQSLPLEEIQSGHITGADLDKLARDFIYAQGYSPENFPHTLGHGLGLQVHEYPSLSQRVQDPIEKDEPFTIEPGIYKEGVGGVRVEDDLVITKKGVEILTHSPKDLICIDPI